MAKGTIACAFLCVTPRALRFVMWYHFALSLSFVFIVLYIVMAKQCFFVIYIIVLYTKERTVLSALFYWNY